ncbi:XK-related protein 8-like [Genypterus blacodes]|uniref:XK-related protein 8-like n=1 Tax=Genypterus blacodes TaxID=154954 RepID=UPI003F764134
MEGPKHSPFDFVMTCLGLFFSLLDIVLDACAVVTFYQEKDYLCLGLLLLFLLGSSVLAQVYSWLWYKYDNYERVTRVEKSLSLLKLRLLHVFQLGVYLRHAGVFEAAICSFIPNQRLSQEKTLFLRHDLSMLGLIETFSESAPQLVLMLTRILHRGLLDPVTVLKAVASASAMAFSVTMYHRSLRFFLTDKKQQLKGASVVYLLWNLLLIAPRLVALTLFASVLPCYILSHFIFSWGVLWFFAWRAQTDFMDSAAGEVLFQATVGLIWFFSWFNVVKGKTRYKSLLYHIYIVADLCFLCGLWCWQIYTQISFLYAIITSVCVVGVYMLGLGLKLVYYRLYHPNIGQQRSKTEHVMCAAPLQEDVVDNSDCDFQSASDSGEEMQIRRTIEMDSGDYTDPPQLDTESVQFDGVPQSAFRSMSVPAPTLAPVRPPHVAFDPSPFGAPDPASVQKRQNKRMMKLAGNFYS